MNIEKTIKTYHGNHIKYFNDIVHKQPTNIVIPEVNHWYPREFRKYNGRSSFSYTQYHEYEEAIRSFNGEPISMTLEELEYEEKYNNLKNIHGMIIPGGVDINPKYYKNKQHKLCGSFDEERDFVELAFTEVAFEHDIPILGVCRGHQMMNIAGGGTLHQDISLAKKDPKNHRAASHLVLSEPRGKFAKIVKSRAFFTNSYHHQCIKKLAKMFRVCAIATDGIIEAIYAPKLKFAVGVQFHPEHLENIHAERIIEALVKAAKRRMK